MRLASEVRVDSGADEGPLGIGSVHSAYESDLARNLCGRPDLGDADTEVGVPACELPLLTERCLVFRFPGMARAEINMVLPLTARQGEMTARGLQMGVGIEFL